MARVKILYVESAYDDCYSTHVAVDGTDWEEVSEDERRLLAKHAKGLPQWNGLSAKLMVESPIPVKETVAQIAAKLAAQEAAAEVKRKEAEAKRSAKARARAAKDIEAKRALLAQLRAELAEPA